jgi:hypothetical protein
LPFDAANQVAGGNREIVEEYLAGLEPSIAEFRDVAPDREAGPALLGDKRRDAAVRGRARRVREGSRFKVQGSRFRVG